MDLITLQKKKEDCRTWKNVEPWFTKIQEVSTKINIDNLSIDYGDWFTVGCKDDLSKEQLELVEETAKKLIPWRSPGAVIYHDRGKWPPQKLFQGINFPRSWENPRGKVPQS